MLCSCMKAGLGHIAASTSSIHQRMQRACHLLVPACRPMSQLQFATLLRCKRCPQADRKCQASARRSTMQHHNQQMCGLCCARSTPRFPPCVPTAWDVSAHTAPAPCRRVEALAFAQPGGASDGSGGWPSAVRPDAWPCCCAAWPYPAGCCGCPCHAGSCCGCAAVWP